MFELQNARLELELKENINLSCIFISENFELSKVLIEKKLRNDLIESFTERFLNITKEKRVIEYDPIVKLNDCIDSISIQEIPNLSNIKNEFEDISTIKLIDKFSDIEASRAYAIILNNKNSNNKIVLFKKFSSSVYLKSKFKILLNEGKMEKINKDILSLNNKFDCAMYKEDMAIFTQLYFEQMFDYKDEYTKKANKTILKIKSLNIIDNIENLQHESEKITIKKKLSKINDKNIDWFKNKVKNNIEDIRNIISKANLDMEIKAGKIVSNDASELIHLIQDDYLKSDLSGDNFVADKKTKIENS